MAGVMLMRAHFTQHSFERHSHATYSIGLTSSGVQTFHCGGSLHVSLAGDLILFNPDQAHDGQRGAPEGFGYSILYVPQDALADLHDADAGIALARHFAHPVARDPLMAQAYRHALGAIGQRGESLRAEELTRTLLTGLLRRHGETRLEVKARSAGTARMERVRDYLCAHACEDVTVQALAEVAGLSRAHLTRAFSLHFGVPPHVYLNAVRLRRAQRAMLDGSLLAEVALACGFADQAHFSRRFKGSFGVAPARWLRQMRG
jgi:AraC-like DNA-binding protein